MAANTREFHDAERRAVAKADVLAALESVLLAPRDANARDPKPDKADRETRYRLDRKR